MNLKFSNPIFETTYRRRDGSIINVEISAAKVEIDGRQLVYNAARNITERKHTEDALQKSSRLYQQLVEASMDGYWMFDGNGRLLDVNDTYARKSGYTRDELLDMRISDLEAQMDAVEITDKIQQFMQAGHARFETMHRSKDGTIWPLEASLAFLPQDGGRFFSFMRDISERKKTEQELRERNEGMEQLLKQEVATQTAAAIAHELNQPLLAIAACSDAALRTFESGVIDRELIAQSLILNKEQAMRAGESLRHLFNILHNQAPVAEAFDINLQIQDSLAEFRKKYMPQFREVLKLERKLPLIHASRLHVQIVIINLLRNSIEAMQAASIRTPELTMYTTKDGNMARFTILDNGPGFQVKDMEHIFEAFYTTKPTGIGMGLKISRSLIKSNGGKLWAESTPGRGATFHFTLPLAL